MSKHVFERAVELFHHARTLPPDQRERYLALECGEDVHLLQEAQRLLEGESRAGKLLQEPAVVTLARWAEEWGRSQSFGSWRVIEEIGRGGMATVYRAERADGLYRKQAALKILRNGVLFDEARWRFERERQILADLNHPNIVRLLDGGVAQDGRPYLVMDYVDGLPLMDYVNQQTLSIEARLELFDRICEAVAFAHSNRIIHRDLKPSNICVTSDGNPKLLDFGIAKLIEPGELATEQTRPGLGFLTLDYASPEQAQGLPTTAATDVFSLGLILYELLTGERLRQLKGLSPLEATRTVCEKQANLSKAGRWQDTLQGALQLDPQQRFTSVEEFRAAIRRGPDPRRLRPVVSRALTLVGGMMMAAIAAFLLWKAAADEKTPMRLVPLSYGNTMEKNPSFSPDGSLILFEQALSIRSRRIGEPRDTRMLQEYALQLPQWSPDGNSFSYFRFNADNINRISIADRQGQNSRHLTDINGNFYSWASDGKSLAVVHKSSADEPSSIYLVDVASGIRRRLSFPPEGYTGDTFCAFSHDGRTLAIARHRTDNEGDIFLLPMEGGSPKRITFDESQIRGVAWTPDGSAIVYSTNRPTDQFELWRVRRDGRQPVRVDGAPEGAFGPSVWRGDGITGKLAFTVESRDVNVWRWEEGKGAKSNNSSHAFDGTPAISPDGLRLALSSNRSGRMEIWMSNTDGAEPFRITYRNGGPANYPRWSPDGKWIAFNAKDRNRRKIYVVSATGGKPRILIPGQAPVEEGRPSWSQDGTWIYYRSNKSGSLQIWKARAADGSDAHQVTTGGAFEGVESPDGRTLYFLRGSTDAGVWQKPLPSGEESVLLPTAREGFWSVSDKAIYYLHRPRRWEGKQVMRYVFATGSNEPVVELPNAQVNNLWSGLSVSRDGKSIYWGQMDKDENTLMLLDNFR